MKHIKTTKPIEKDYWNWVHQKLERWIKKKCEQGEKRIRHWENKSHWLPLSSPHTCRLHASKMDCSCSFLCKTKLSTCALNSIPSFVLKNFAPIIPTCFTRIYSNVCSLPDNSHWLTSRLYFSHSEYERKYEVSLEPTCPACYLCTVLLPFHSNNPWLTFLPSSLLRQFCLKSSPIRFCPQIYTHDSCC